MNLYIILIQLFEFRLNFRSKPTLKNIRENGSGILKHREWTISFAIFIRKWECKA